MRFYNFYLNYGKLPLLSRASLLNHYRRRIRPSRIDRVRHSYLLEKGPRDYLCFPGDSSRHFFRVFRIPAHLLGEPKEVCNSRLGHLMYFIRGIKHFLLHDALVSATGHNKRAAEAVHLAIPNAVTNNHDRILATCDDLYFRYLLGACQDF